MCIDKCFHPNKQAKNPKGNKSTKGEDERPDGIKHAKVCLSKLDVFHGTRGCRRRVRDLGDARGEGGDARGDESEREGVEGVEGGEEGRGEEGVAVHVDGVDGAEEAVEVGHGGGGVGAHVGEEEPVADVEEGHGDVLADAVERVAGGPKDGAGDDGAGGELGRAGREEGARERVLVVKEDAVEAVVDAVVDVVEDLDDVAVVVGDDAAAVDVGDERVGAGGKVAPGLGDEAGAARELREHGEEVHGDVVDGRGRGLVAEEAAADVEERHLEAVLPPEAEDGERVRRGGGVRGRVGAAAAHVVADADDAQAELGGGREETRHAREVRTKLAAEAAERVRVVGDDAQHQLGLGVDLRHLEQLVLVVKGHAPHAEPLRVGNLRGHLARVRKDYALRCNAQRRDAVHLVAARTVKARPEPVQHPQERRVRVALDCVVRLHARQRGLPSLVEGHHWLQVNHVERLMLVLFAPGQPLHGDGTSNALCRGKGVGCVDVNTCRCVHCNRLRMLLMLLLRSRPICRSIGLMKLSHTAQTRLCSLVPAPTQSLPTTSGIGKHTNTRTHKPKLPRQAARLMFKTLKEKKKKKGRGEKKKERKEKKG